MAKSARDVSVRDRHTARLIDRIEATLGYRRPIGFGVCRVDLGQTEPTRILACDYPVVNWGTRPDSAALFQHAAGLTAQAFDQAELVLPVTERFLRLATQMVTRRAGVASTDPNLRVLRYLNANGRALADLRLTFIYRDAPPQSVPTAYLKLLALSTKAVPLQSINLNGVFGILPNVMWAGRKPYEHDYLRENEIAMKLDGTYPAITAVDKFPRFLHHVIPDETIRVLDDSRVRLGAQLADGTVVMPGASYVNFNAGTLGRAMVEGRISSGCIVGADSDIGGGASLLGILSGGNTRPVTIGKRCLLGANSVTGISLGDDCIVDAGTSVLAGTKVALSYDDVDALRRSNTTLSNSIGKAAPDGIVVKAATLAGLHALHFRRDSQTGQMSVGPVRRTIELNQALHGQPTV